MIKDIQALIFGAGFGIRLLPLTQTCPKVAVPVLNKPVILRIIENLKSAGITNFVINSHYLAQTLREIVGNGEKWGVNIIYSHEDEILETGGGLKNAQPLIQSQTFILHNGDIVCDIDYEKLIRFHRAKGSVATLAVSKRHIPKQLVLDSDNKIIDIRKTFFKNREPEYTFLGIHVLEKEIFDRIKPDEKISIIPVYLEMISKGIPVYAWELEEGLWYDIGSIEEYKKANFELMENIVTDTNGFRLFKSSSCIIDKSALMRGCVCVGEQSVIEKKVFLKNAIIWNNAVIKEGSLLEDVIVRDFKSVKGTHKGEII